MEPDHPVRHSLAEMEKQWRSFLVTTAGEAVEGGELRADLDLEQFVWELSGIYLNHHVSHRFLRDPNANARDHGAFESLVERSSLSKQQVASKTN